MSKLAIIALDEGGQTCGTVCNIIESRRIRRWASPCRSINSHGTAGSTRWQSETAGRTGYFPATEGR